MRTTVEKVEITARMTRKMRSLLLCLGDSEVAILGWFLLWLLYAVDEFLVDGAEMGRGEEMGSCLKWEGALFHRAARTED